MSKDKRNLSDKELVREAGCKCRKPLLGNKPNVGPRCRLCNTQVVMVKRGVGY